MPYACQVPALKYNLSSNSILRPSGRTSTAWVGAGLMVWQIGRVCSIYDKCEWIQNITFLILGSGNISRSFHVYSRKVECGKLTRIQLGLAFSTSFFTLRRDYTCRKKVHWDWWHEWGLGPLYSLNFVRRLSSLILQARRSFCLYWSIPGTIGKQALHGLAWPTGRNCTFSFYAGFLDKFLESCLLKTFDGDKMAVSSFLFVLWMISFQWHCLLEMDEWKRRQLETEFLPRRHKDFSLEEWKASSKTVIYGTLLGNRACLQFKLDSWRNWGLGAPEKYWFLLGRNYFLWLWVNRL